MPDKKMNVLDRLLCVFRQKKEICPDIISQADNVIEQYIYEKNRLIHRKCATHKNQDRFINAAVFTAAVILGITVFKILI